MIADYAAAPSRRHIVLLVVVLAIIWFANLEGRKLVRPDEGRYAEVAREMVVTGDWVTPRQNGLKYFEKPILQYWTTAAAYELFGVHHWTARLWAALTGFGGVLLAGFVAGRLWRARAGLFAATVAASSLLYVLIAHLNTLDMGVTFFLNLGLLALMLAQREPAGGAAAAAATARAQVRAASLDTPRNWMWLAWAALGLAVLSKGLIGAALPAASLLVYTLWSRDWALWKRMHLVSGLLIFLAVAAPWFIIVSIKNPEFFQFFFIHEHIDRFLTKAHSRAGPFWYFVPILLLGMLPWTLLMIESCVRAFPREAAPGFQPKRFLLTWIVFVFAFFSVSNSKLPSYILPVFPAAALLIGEYLARIRPRVLAAHTLPVMVTGIATLFLAPQATRLADVEVPLALYQAYVPWLVGAAALMTASAALALVFSVKGRTLAAVIALGLGALGSAQLVLTGHDSLSPASSTYHLVEQIKPLLKPDAPFYSISIYDQTLPFYIGRNVTLVEYTGELSFGVELEPGGFMQTYGEFEKHWRTDAFAMAIMHPGTLVYFERNKVPYTIIARDTRRVIVRKP